MPRHHVAVAAIVFAVFAAGCAPASPRSSVVQAALPAESDADKAPDCPVTQPQQPAFAPPSPWPATHPFDRYFWYGSEALWTELNTDGVWSELPYDEGTGYGQKAVWWRVGYDYKTEPLPALTVTARRLDGDPHAPAETARVSAATNGYHPDFNSFMLVGMDFPSAGCWEISADYHGDRLTFVVRVEP